MKPLGIEMLDIVVDGCAAHGCWFDLGELGVVARWFELRARGLDESTARLALLLQRASTNSRRSRKKKRKKKKKASR